MGQRKILIANRGEIAIRVAKTCSRLGLLPYGIYSEADKDSLHIKYCIESVNIGGFRPSESYLCIDKVIEAAKKLGCDMVHPGYGFLAENSSFARSCERSGLVFIGPSSSTLELSGDKARAREVASEVAPVLSGREISSEQEALELVERIGFPAIIKAVKGGGGRGLRVVYSNAELLSALNSSRSESMLSFGSERLYIEKYLENPRHIEVQILGDSRQGAAIHLGERECSVQRRHQKLIEETPSTALTPTIRERLVQTAVSIAKKMRYDNAGTVEFLFKGGAFYFMELNSRIQVEHPITELVTGVDIVEQQLRIASGEGIGPSQEEIRPRGHAIECRINAEHPITFSPYPGVVEKFDAPVSTADSNATLRLDTLLYPGYSIPPFYDSLIAKLICHAQTRNACIDGMAKALASIRITGIPTTIPFHLAALRDDRFVRGNYDTSFVEGMKLLSSQRAGGAAALFSIIPRKRTALKVQETEPDKDFKTDQWMSAVRLEATSSSADLFEQKWKSGGQT